MSKNETETETTETAAKLSPIDELDAEYQAAGKKCSADAAKKLLKAWEDCRAAKGKAEAALAKAILAERAAIADIVRARGKGTFRDSSGKLYTPMGRYDKAGNAVLIMRGEGGKDVPSFG